MESPADHDTPTINSHLASGPGQPPARPRARPLPPGRPPVTHVTPFPHPIDPNVRRACMKAAGRYRPEARRPPPVPGPCQPTGWAGEGTGPGSAQRGTRGPRMCPHRASRCPCALAGWLFMVWRSWVVFAAGSSPRHPPGKEHVHVCVGGAYARLALPTDNPSSVHE